MSDCIHRSSGMSPANQSVPVLVARDLFAWFLLFQPTATMQSSAARSGYCTFGTAHEAHRADGISAARATGGSSRARVRFEKAARIDASPVIGMRIEGLG